MLSKYSVKKPFTIVVATIIIIILGIVSYTKMSLELIPDVSMPYAAVITVYPGASPEEIEAQVTGIVEDSVFTINNIDDVVSTSSENMSVVYIKFNDNTNMDTAVVDMREKLDYIKDSLPEGTQSPMIMKMDPSMMPISVYGVTKQGATSEETSRLVSDKIKGELSSVEGVANVTAAGLIENMVNISISQNKLDDISKKLSAAMMSSAIQPNISAGSAGTQQMFDPSTFKINKDMVKNIISGQNFAMPGGSVTDDDNTSYLIRVGDKIKSLDELENLAVFSLPGLGEIKLKDVCDITTLDNSENMYTKINDENAFVLSIQKQPQYSTAEVSKSINEKVDEIESENDGIQFTPLMDQGKYVEIMINTIVKNLIIGGIFAFIILLVFLKRIRPTFIVGMSIVISLITAFVLMYFSGVTLNMISMGGLALGVGMLVDNSIVVIENIYRMRAEGKSYKEAAIEGSKEVSGAITASTLTTIIVFVPIVFTQGLTRQLFSDMALTIAYSLLASLIVALTLVPAACAAIKKDSHVTHKFMDKVINGYIKSLKYVLNKKILTCVVVLILFGISILVTFSSGVELFPEMDSGEIILSIEMPDNYNDKDTIKGLEELNGILNNIKDIDTASLSYAGSSSTELSFNTMMGSSAIQGYLLIDDNSKRTTNEVVDEIREKTKNLKYKVTASSSSMDISAISGGDIVVNLYSKDLDTLKKMAEDTADIIKSVDGAADVDNGVGKVQPVLKITVDKNKAMAQGLTVAQVYAAVYNSTKSDKAVTRISFKDNDYDIYVKDDSDKVYNNKNIGEITIETPTGNTVKVSDVAAITPTEGMSSISHENKERFLSVTASLKDGYKLNKVTNEIQDKLEDYKFESGSTYEIAGQMESIYDTFKDMILMIVLAVIFIYLVMVAQFQSLKSPFIIMFTLPLAFTGGMFGLFVSGTKVSTVALIGFVVLAGVVVNNGIVFVDYANQMVSKGMTVYDALIITGRNRLRPILMTALTTIFALIVSIFDKSEGAELLTPIAITVAAGLLYATLLTLFLVPVIYMLFNKKKDRKIAVK